MRDFPRHQALLAHIQNKLEEDLDLAHDLEHVLRVYRWAIRLAKEEHEDPDLAGAAALIHDLVNVPKESKLRSDASLLSAIEGASVLPTVGYNVAETEIILGAVKTCSWSKGQQPTSRIGAILQDADRLDAIGAIGVMRNIACAQAMRSRGNSGQLYHPEDPLGKSRRELNDRQFAIDHFFRKLLLIKDGFHTGLAQKEAKQRHLFLETFLTRLNLEVTSVTESSAGEAL